VTVTVKADSLLLLKLVAVGVACAAILGAVVACTMGEEYLTLSMTTQPSHGASYGISAGSVAAWISLWGRRREVGRIVDL
jgi:hypothetical protein